MSGALEEAMPQSGIEGLVTSRPAMSGAGRGCVRVPIAHIKLS